MTGSLEWLASLPVAVEAAALRSPEWRYHPTCPRNGWSLCWHYRRWHVHLTTHGRGGRGIWSAALESGSGNRWPSQPLFPARGPLGMAACMRWVEAWEGDDHD